MDANTCALTFMRWHCQNLYINRNSTHTFTATYLSCILLNMQAVTGCRDSVLRASTANSTAFPSRCSSSSAL